MHHELHCSNLQLIKATSRCSWFPAYIYTYVEAGASSTHRNNTVLLPLCLLLWICILLSIYFQGKWSLCMSLPFSSPGKHPIFICQINQASEMKAGHLPRPLENSLKQMPPCFTDGTSDITACPSFTSIHSYTCLSWIFYWQCFYPFNRRLRLKLADTIASLSKNKAVPSSLGLLGLCTSQHWELSPL